MVTDSNNFPPKNSYLPLPLPPWLEEEAGDRLSAKVEFLRHTPQRIVWLGDAPEWLSALAQRYPDAARCAYTIAPPSQSQHGQLEERPRDGVFARWWRRLRRAPKSAATPVADPALLPESPGSVDLLLANLLLFRAARPEALLTAWQQLLAANAPLFFATLGPDTLKELRAALHREGLRAIPDTWPPFPDMHDLGDLLLRLRFAEPVMDMQMLTVHYASAEALAADWGAWLGEAQAVLTTLSYPFTLSVELVFGHAWRPAQQPAASARASATPQPIHWHPQRR